jgi:hypothetical protein
VLRTLPRRRHDVVLITHKLDEVMAVSGPHHRDAPRRDRRAIS